MLLGVLALIVVAAAVAATQIGGGSKAPKRSASHQSPTPTTPFRQRTFPYQTSPFPTPTVPNQTIPSTPTPNPTTPNPTTPTTPTTPTVPTTPTTSSVALRPINWLGMEIVTVPPGEAVVETVTPNSTADQAGLEPGDVMREVNGHAIETTGEITRALDGKHKGDKVAIEYARGGTILITTEVTLGAAPSTYP